MLQYRIAGQHILTFMIRLFAAILAVRTGLRFGDERVKKADSVCRARVERLTMVKSDNVSCVRGRVCSEFS
jgi:hypothetical protein